MTKTVEVEVLDKSCETCPMFEVDDDRVFIIHSAAMDKYGSTFKNYTCAHQDFCRAVLKNWERCRKEETV